MEKIFLNFRTGDQDMAAPFLYQCLARWFGKEAIFFSSRSIPGGVRFPDELEQHARKCRVLLALIGPRWLTMTGSDGRTLLADPEDWVRREIATALSAGRSVIPVLVGNAPRLTSTGLSADLSPLAEIEYRYLRRSDLDTDLQTIREDLIRLVPRLRPRPEAESGAGISVTAKRAKGQVTGVTIGQVRTGGRNLPDLLGPVSVNVDRIDKGSVVNGVDIGTVDLIEDWGNVGEKHPPWPELLA